MGWVPGDKLAGPSTLDESAAKQIQEDAFELVAKDAVNDYGSSATYHSPLACLLVYLFIY